MSIPFGYSASARYSSPDVLNSSPVRTGLMIAFILVFFCSCKTSRFVRKNDFITDQQVFPKDSVTVLAPFFSTWSVTFRTRANFEWELFGDMIELPDRADTIRKLLRETYQVTPITDTAFFKVSSGCLFTWQLEDKSGVTPYTMLKSLDSTSGYSILNPGKYRCIPLDPARYNILYVFVMSLWSDAIGDEIIDSRIEPIVLVLYKNRIVYYRHYLDYVEERKRDFPKGSWERENFPYFPGYQLTRVVDTLSSDLKSRIK